MATGEKFPPSWPFPSEDECRERMAANEARVKSARMEAVAEAYQDMGDAGLPTSAQDTILLMLVAAVRAVSAELIVVKDSIGSLASIIDEMDV